MTAPTSNISTARPMVIVGLDALDHWIGTVCRGVVLSTGAALLVSIAIGVVARYVITVGGVDWAEEVPKQLFAWFIMSGVVLAVQGGNHIAVDLVMHYLSPGALRILVVLTNLLVCVAYVYLFGVAMEVAELAAAERNPVLGTPGSLPFYALAAGAVLTAVGSLSIAIRVWVLGADARPQGNPEDSVE
ncbi:MAG TPA: TRAP transporter small permease [Xanthomonadaceae bacterium]|nr:TRAP transporter small permease [Xanthomonadaceae bacterium]